MHYIYFEKMIYIYQKNKGSKSIEYPASLNHVSQVPYYTAISLSSNFFDEINLMETLTLNIIETWAIVLVSNISLVLVSNLKGFSLGANKKSKNIEIQIPSFPQ